MIATILIHGPDFDGSRIKRQNREQNQPKTKQPPTFNSDQASISFNRSALNLSLLPENK